MLATTDAPRPPTVDDIKKLSMADVAIAAGLSDSLRERLRHHVAIDPFTVADPFAEGAAGYTYSVVLDREDPRRVVAMLVSKPDPLPQLPWSSILGPGLAKVAISADEAKALKSELMPKEWGNFYPYRRNGRISGYVMFAFQVCGMPTAA